MTAWDFLGTLEAYYGIKYSEVQRAVVGQWLSDNHSSVSLGAMLPVVYRRHSGEYRRLPLVADLLKLRDEVDHEVTKRIKATALPAPKPEPQRVGLVRDLLAKLHNKAERDKLLTPGTKERNDLLRSLGRKPAEQLIQEELKRRESRREART